MNKETFLADLQAFFEKTPIPENYKFGPKMRIVNPSLFLTAHFGMVNAGWGMPWARPYLTRLVKIREQLSAGKPTFEDENSDRPNLEGV